MPKNVQFVERCLSRIGMEAGVVAFGKNIGEDQRKAYWEKYEQRKKARWEKHFEAYKEYVKKTRQQPPWNFTRHKGVLIGKWLFKEIIPKRHYLSDEQIELLKELGLEFNLSQFPDSTRSPSTKGI